MSRYMTTNGTDDLLVFDFVHKLGLLQNLCQWYVWYMQTSQGLYFIEYYSSGNNKTKVSLLAILVQTK